MPRNNEVWRDVIGFPNYQVSNLGRVRSKKYSLVLKPFPFKKTEPYLAVDLMLCGMRTRRAVHQLVLEAFVGPRPHPFWDSIHKDGDGSNNKLNNLEWGTKEKNQADRLLHGTDCRGERSPLAKLNKNQVREIRRRRAAGESAKSILKDFPMIKNHDYIYRLAYGKVWSHVGN